MSPYKKNEPKHFSTWQLKTGNGRLCCILIMICLINQLCEVITNHKLRIITAECSSITCTNSYLNIKSSTAIYSCKRSDYQLHVLADVKWISHERYHRSWHFTTVLRTTIRSLFGSLSAAFKIRLDRYLAPKGLNVLVFNRVG